MMLAHKQEKNRFITFHGLMDELKNKLWLESMSFLVLLWDCFHQPSKWLEARLVEDSCLDLNEVFAACMADTHCCCKSDMFICGPRILTSLMTVTHYLCVSSQHERDSVLNLIEVQRVPLSPPPPVAPTRTPPSVVSWTHTLVQHHECICQQDCAREA